MRNSELVSALKWQFLAQFLAQWGHIYGLQTRMWRWSKIIFAIYSIQVFPLFLTCDEQLVSWPRKTKYPLMECLVFGVIALALIPLSSTLSSFPGICIQVATICLYALSLYCYQLDDILSFAHSLNLCVAEAAVILALIWSLFSTYFFSTFPFLTYPEELLLEQSPCFLHIGFALASNFIWCLLTIYIHHRTQIAVDARKCGVWQRCSPGEHKTPSWKSNHKYSKNVIVSVSSKAYYKLLSATSSYQHPPVDGLLSYRELYLPLLASETGPLYKSKVIAALIISYLLTICMSLISLVFMPYRHRVYALFLVVVQFALMYSTRKAYNLNGSMRDKYVYDPHGIPSPPHSGN